MLAHEYGWSAEYIMDIPIDIAPLHVHAILNRRGLRVFKRVASRDESAPSLADRMKQILASIDTAPDV